MRLWSSHVSNLFIPLELNDLACETRVVGVSSGVGTGKIVKRQRVVEYASRV